MDIDIAVLARLKLITRHKKFAVQLFVQLIEDQTSLCRHQGTVRVGVTLVSDVTDRLALCVDLIHHMDKIQLVVAVITIAFGYCRIDSLESTFDNVLDRDPVFFKGLRPVICKLTDKCDLICRKLIQNAGC